MSVLDVCSTVTVAVYTARQELSLFIVAVLVHYFVSGTSYKKNPKLKIGGAKQVVSSAEPSRPSRPTSHSKKTVGSEGLGFANGPAQALHSSTLAYKRSDFQMVLRYWPTLKQETVLTPLYLVEVAECMQWAKMDASVIVSELCSCLRGLALFSTSSLSQDKLAFINEMLSYFPQSLDTQVTRSIVEFLPSLNLVPDSNIYETLLRVAFQSRNFLDVNMYVREMQSNGVSPTMQTQLFLFQCALETGNAHKAMTSYATVADLVTEAVAHQFVQLAFRNGQVEAALEAMSKANAEFSYNIVHSLLQECSKTGDTAIADKLHIIALRSMEGRLPWASDAVVPLVRFYSGVGQPAKTCALFDGCKKFDAKRSHQRYLPVDGRTERCVILSYNLRQV